MSIGDILLAVKTDDIVIYCKTCNEIFIKASYDQFMSIRDECHNQGKYPPWYVNACRHYVFHRDHEVVGESHPSMLYSFPFSDSWNSYIEEEGLDDDSVYKMLKEIERGGYGRNLLYR